MAALGVVLVTQRRERRVHGVQQPEVGDFAGGEFGPRFFFSTAGGAGEARTFFFEDFYEAAEDGHQAVAGADFDGGRDERFVEDEVSGAVAHDAGYGERDQVACGFGVEQELDVFAADVDGFFVAARGLIVEHLDFGSETQGSVFLGAAGQ